MNFRKLIRSLGALLRHPWLLNRVLEDDIWWKDYITRKYDLPNGLPVISFGDLFTEMEETVSPFAFLEGGSLPTDLALLKGLAGNVKGCSYFEIGTWRGESVANVARVAKECFTLNLSAKEMARMGLSKEYIDLHGYFSREMENVTHLEGNSMDFDFASLGRTFDLIFIDGDHHYESVKNDTEKVFQHLLHPGSVIVWHDYARNPEAVRYEVLAGIMDGCPYEKRERLFFVANTLCAIYIERDFPHKSFDPPMSPEHYFDLTLRWR